MSTFATAAAAIPMANSRACDCCNRRKVKCDRGQPCQSCFRAELACTYAAIPRKRGPKGPSAKRIYAIKQDQLRSLGGIFSEDNSRNDSRSPSSDADEQLINPPLSFTSYASGTGEQIDAAALFTAFLQCDHPPSNYSDVFEPHPMLTQSSVGMCLKIFFKNLYPIMPVVDQTSFLARVNNLSSDPELYSLVSSLCAMTMVQLLAVPGDHNGAITSLSETLISESLRARKYCDYIGSPSIETVLTSFFLFCSYGNLEKHNHAWYYLRESISFAQSIGLDEEKSYSRLDPGESQQRRRIFWLLFITERAYALQRHRPLSLHQIIALPSEDNSVDPVLLSNFITLATLFQNVDHPFLNLWNEGNDPEFSEDWIFKLQQQLMSTIPPLTDVVRIQKADILVSQQWLHLLVWQLALAKGCLSSTAPAETMRLQFPVTIAKSLLEVTSKVSLGDLEAHGIGMQEKIFDVGCALSDVIMCIPNVATPAFEVGPRDCLQELINLLFSLRGGNSRYLQSLVEKVEDVLQLNTPSTRIFPGIIPSYQDYDRIASESERSRTSSPSDSETLADFIY